MTPNVWLLVLPGAMWIALGAHQIVFAAEVQQQMDERNLKWSFGSRYDRRWWQGARGIGIFNIFVGATWMLMQLGDHRPVDLTLLRWMGALRVAIGLWSLVFEPHVSAWWWELRRRPAGNGGPAPYSQDERPGGSEVPGPGRSTAARQWHGAMALFFGASTLILASTI